MLDYRVQIHVVSEVDGDWLWRIAAAVVSWNACCRRYVMQQSSRATDVRVRRMFDVVLVPPSLFAAAIILVRRTATKNASCRYCYTERCSHRPNETKMSRRELERAWLRDKETKSSQTKYNTGSRSAPLHG